VDLAGELWLSGGRTVPVRILNLGTMGALLEATDLEEAIFEGERAALDHPLLEGDRPGPRRARTPGSVVRVQLEFAPEGVSRHLALFFDGGAWPEGCRAR
jgi:hypothetical protein